MEAFLDKLAGHLAETSKGDFSRTCLVFPGRRAALFFRQYLSRRIDKPVWLPEIFALEDFVIQKSGLRLSDPLDLIARLYKVYRTLEKENAQPFGDFISWGNMLLGDFDEIDQYLADGQKVFQYLDEIKALKLWNPDGKPLTDFERGYLHFYNSLAPCYRIFREELLADGEAYFGLAFEKLLSEIKDTSFAGWDRIIFAGFNALTAAEEKLLTLLSASGKAEIFWDADRYYLDDPRQEAGRFLRSYLRDEMLKGQGWVGNHLTDESRNIQIIGVPGNAGQAKLAGQLIRERIAEKGSADGVALVLVDEGLLLPVLNSIPAECPDFNVTMGFPLKLTPVYTLVDSIMSLFVNAVKLSNTAASSEPLRMDLLRFYHRDLRRFLAHPYIFRIRTTARVSDEDGNKAEPDRSFYKPGELLQYLGRSHPAIRDIFGTLLQREVPDAAALMALVAGIISLAGDSPADEQGDGIIPAKEHSPAESEFLFHAEAAVAKIAALLEDPLLCPDLATLQSMTGSLIAGQRIPFFGEPLHGLQVMGMLETRLLDFKDIIMVSVNEGLLPKGKRQSTFIPDEVRKAFGMQRYSERTAVFAYHFYRLIQRAGNVSLFYNTEGTDLGGGEKSRFISQLLHELPKVNPAAVISERMESLTPSASGPVSLQIEKNDRIRTRLHAMAERGISPSALSVFMRCGLQFCLAHVMRIGEPDEVSESIDAAMLGEIVHEALHHLYEGSKNVAVTPESIKGLLAEADDRVHAAFAARFSEAELSNGKNLLIVGVARNMVKRFLRQEQQELRDAGMPLTILMLEESLQTTVSIKNPDDGSDFPVRIHGKADRIDRLGGTVRIVDYKTGKCEPKDLKVAEVEEVLQMKNPAKFFQVMTYALMYSDAQAAPPPDLISGIVSLRMVSSYLIPTVIGKSESIDPDNLEQFREVLREILSEIFDPEKAFRQTDDTEVCKLCVFSAICNRSGD
jgi:ATP-dependent helicase/nuclease subunit B